LKFLSLNRQVLLYMVARGNATLFLKN
jgi:hypothetical protein